MNREGDRELTALFAAYAVATLLLVAVSARLWWQSPLNLIAYEFDYFRRLDPVARIGWSINVYHVGDGP